MYEHGGPEGATQRQGTSAATGHGPLSLPITVGNDISSNEEILDSEQYGAEEDG